MGELLPPEERIDGRFRRITRNMGPPPIHMMEVGVASICLRLYKSFGVSPLADMYIGRAFPRILFSCLRQEERTRKGCKLGQIRRTGRMMDRSADSSPSGWGDYFHYLTYDDLYRLGDSRLE